jgi:hypothetical protein
MRRRPLSLPPATLALGTLLVALVAACGSGGAAPASFPGTAPGGSSQPGQSATGSSQPGEPATSSTGPSVIPVIIGQQQTGPSRFLFAFLDADGNLPVGSPDRTAQVAFQAPGASEPGPPVPSEFVWAIEGSRGVYIAHTEFPTAGAWKAIFITQSPTSAQEAIGVSFDVQDDLPPVDIGQPAPASDTPTAADVGGNLAMISTDANPDPAFYQLSVADALAQRKPFVLIFATPAFCQSAQCGPDLDRLKEAAATAPADIVFINVEPYQLTFTEGRLQPVLDANNQLQPVAAVEQWGILSEPWIFAVDGSGIVRASFEGVVTDTELQDVFAEISGT